jgi:hypothetical protein
MDSSRAGNRFTGTIDIGRKSSGTDGEVQRSSYAELPFTPEIESMCVLPSQYHTRRNNGQFEGERRLFAAVLEDAIYCYFSCRDAQSYHMRVVFFEAKRWLEDKRRSKLFSFENVCETLGINSNRLRTSIERLSRKMFRASSGPDSLAELETADPQEILKLGRRHPVSLPGRGDRRPALTG